MKIFQNQNSNPLNYANSKSSCTMAKKKKTNKKNRNKRKSPYARNEMVSYARFLSLPSSFPPQPSHPPNTNTTRRATLSSPHALQTAHKTSVRLRIACAASTRSRTRASPSPFIHFEAALIHRHKLANTLHTPCARASSVAAALVARKHTGHQSDNALALDLLSHELIYVSSFLISHRRAHTYAHTQTHTYTTKHNTNTGVVSCRGSCRTQTHSTSERQCIGFVVA
jgi:hypothetical protein